jgi:ArsR family transcriptional regulator, arsenate/arsenite/antimonite-responsive transcriptional repressor
MEGFEVERSEAEEYARWFRCLADATRLQLLRILAERGASMTIGELVDAVSVGQSSVSGHVQRLAAADFVVVKRAGTTTYVRINEDCLSALPAAAAAIMARDRETATQRCTGESAAHTAST